MWDSLIMLYTKQVIYTKSESLLDFVLSMSKNIMNIIND
ncbi:hypothetical protein SAMN05444285_102227 [Draconibacterium orientale]|uniref:Uncharacterized protein n=1 Tax=Draconibacterium orientale TaxID=1168034 RepID=A0A1H9ZPK3_9BACT|nr:hypothetical protein SAMN05444285_102227 [Draconibacterium orientale]